MTLCTKRVFVPGKTQQISIKNIRVFAWESFVLYVALYTEKSESVRTHNQTCSRRDDLLQLPTNIVYAADDPKPFIHQI